VRIPSASFFALIASFLLLSTGCYYPPDNSSVYGPERTPEYAPIARVPTSLVIVIEGEFTEEQYRARRLDIVNYLIERGYISQESELISDPANASRIVRAIVNSEGFSLSVFNQNTAVTAVPDLETTDILYPEDPYFIFGFDYMYEIGPRRLPPRPRDYHPHPRPPHSNPPPGRPVWDHDRHWTRPGTPSPGRPGQPDRTSGHNRNGDHSRPDKNAPVPRPIPPQANPLPETTPAPTPAGNRPTRPTGPAPRPRLNPPPGTDNQPGEKTEPHSGNRPNQTPGTVPSRNPNQPRPERDVNGQPVPPRTSPANTPQPAVPVGPRGGDRPGPRHPDQPPRPSPPVPVRPVEAPRPAPAPARSAPPPEPKDRTADDKDRHDAQR